MKSVTDTLPIREVGDTWDRVRFEVHARLKLDGVWHDWRCSFRSAKTQAEAEKQISDSRETGASLQWFIDQGTAEYRIVRVESKLTRVA